MDTLDQKKPNEIRLHFGIQKQLAGHIMRTALGLKLHVFMLCDNPIHIRFVGYDFWPASHRVHCQHTRETFHGLLEFWIATGLPMPAFPTNPLLFQKNTGGERKNWWREWDPIDLFHSPVQVFNDRGELISYNGAPAKTAAKTPMKCIGTPLTRSRPAPFLPDEIEKLKKLGIWKVHKAQT